MDAIPLRFVAGFEGWAAVLAIASWPNPYRCGSSICPSGEHFGKDVVIAVRATLNGLVLVGLAEGALLGVAFVMAGVSQHLRRSGDIRPGWIVPRTDDHGSS